jgi:cytochrome b561
MATDTTEQTPRDRAVQQLKKRRDFYGHLLIYVLVNAFLVVIWAISHSHGFFWPVFPIVGWGIAVVMNAWDVFWRPGITEENIQHEIKREQDREHEHS